MMEEALFYSSSGFFAGFLVGAFFAWGYQKIVGK